MGAYAIYPHDEAEGLNSEQEMAEAYGKLYNWYAVDDTRGLCPAGWRVPTNEEITALTDYIKGNIQQDDAANVLKSGRQVNSPLGGDCDTEEHPRWNENQTHHGTDDLEFDAYFDQPGWRRVSISFNTRASKVYLDDARLLNIPNMDFNPLGITIGYHNPSGRDHIGYIKNIRVAQGAVPLYDKFLTDGKIITHGIRFDVNKSTIRPESRGVINEIVSLMQDYPELTFSVEGHTDSDGAAGANQLVSATRFALP